MENFQFEFQLIILFSSNVYVGMLKNRQNIETKFLSR